MTVPANKIATGRLTLSGSEEQLIPTAFNYQASSIRITNKGATNEVTYSVSGGTTTGDIIEPGTSVSIAITDPRRIYVNGTASDVVAYTIVYGA